VTAPRIVACLDVADGRVVKGVRFTGLADRGDPAALAAAYEAQGADELVLLDVTATLEARPALLDAVRRTAVRLSIPLTVGGGVRTLDDADRLLRAGADKVSVNSAALARPELLGELAARYGRQCVVAAIDARAVAQVPANGATWEVLSHGGRQPTGRDALDWAKDAVRAGAGELLVTSIDRDGTKSGYDVPLLTALRRRVDVPLVASGGAGGAEHLRDALRAGADAVLVAGLLHDGTTTIDRLKRELARHGVPVRPVPPEVRT
jgi:cyclase